MSNFNSFYNDGANFLIEQFLLIEGKETNILNGLLEKKKPLRFSKTMIDLVQDSPEKINTATTFIPVSDKIEMPPEKSPGVTLFVSKKIIRESGDKNRYTTKGSDAQARGILIAEGDYDLTRKKVLARLKGWESITLKNEDTGTVFEFVAKAGTLEKYVYGAGSISGETKEIDSETVKKAESEFEKKLTEQNIPTEAWTGARQEAIQAVGLVIDSEKIFDKLLGILYGTDDEFEDVDFDKVHEDNKFRKVVQPLIDAMKTNDASDDLEYFIKQSNNEKFRVMDWIQIARLMLGSSMFFKSIVSNKISNPHILHQSISEFRKLTSNDAEESNKPSTADAAISNVPADKLLDLIEKNELTPNEDGSIIVGENLATFYQISFKRDASSQIGAVTSFIAANYKLQSREEAGKELGESVIVEGILSSIKKGAEQIKNIGKTLITKIVEFVKNSTKWFRNFVASLSSNSNKNKNKYAVELFGNILTEAETSYDELVSKFDALSESEKIESAKNAMKKINVVLKSIETKMNNVRNCRALIDFFTVDSVGKNTFNALVGNYTVAKTLESMITEMNEPEKVIKGITDILAHALFGKTKLPIYIVYTADGEGEIKEPVLLSEKSKFKSEKVKSISSNLNDEVPLMFFLARENSNQENAGTYLYKLYTLSEIIKTENDIDFKMMEYRIDTGNQIVIKATTEKTMEQVYSVISGI